MKTLTILVLVLSFLTSMADGIPTQADSTFYCDSTNESGSSTIKIFNRPDGRTIDIMVDNMVINTMATKGIWRGNQAILDTLEGTINDSFELESHDGPIWRLFIKKSEVTIILRDQATSYDLFDCRKAN